MLSRYEYLYTKQKAKKLSDKLFEFENGRMWDERTKSWFEINTYKTYRDYMNLLEVEKFELKKRWDEYYKRCSESKYGKIFWSIKQLYLMGDIQGIKELAKKSDEIINVAFVVKPGSIDPNELTMKMNTYFGLKYELKILEDLVVEYSQIYEKKSEQMGL